MESTATTAAPEPGSAAERAADADLPESIDDSRGLIDALDADLVALVERRRAVSQHIHALRVAAGGVRVALSREYVVVDRYRDALGDAGSALATGLLEICRGPL
jgi:chorismate mutase